MTTPLSPSTLTPPFQQVQNFNPVSMNPFEFFHESQVTNQNINQAKDRIVNDINEVNRNIMSNLGTNSQFTNQNIANGVDRVVGGLNDSTQYLTANVNTVSKDLNAAALGLRDAVERGNLVNGNAIERTAGDIKLNSTILDAANRQAANDSIRDVLRGVDSMGNLNNSTTERVGSNLNSTVERTAAQIERLAGEGRLTTTVTDAASRQAMNDSARDVIRAVSATDVAVERTAGETRANFLNSAAQMTGLITDTRKTITEGINRGTNELLGQMTSNTDNLNGMLTSMSSENRVSANLAMLETVRGNNLIAQQSAAQSSNILLEQQKIGAALSAQGAKSFADILLEQQKSAAVLSHEGTKQYADILLEQQKAAAVLSAQGARSFSDLMLEQQKSTAVLSHEGTKQYADIMLEQQKTTAVLAHEGSNHHASLLLEQQRVKEYLAGKGDAHFAMNQLELQKVKEGLAYQAAQNFASLQLEAAKTSGLISAQLAEAKYDALKNTQFLADKMGDCCCEVKMKIDTIDRDRLRDNLIVERIEHHEDHRDHRRRDHGWDDRRVWDDRRGRDGRDGRDGRWEDRDEGRDGGRGGRGGGEGR